MRDVLLRDVDEMQAPAPFCAEAGVDAEAYA